MAIEGITEERVPHSTFRPADSASRIPLRFLDVSFKAPALNLAFDEVLLNEAEEERAGETLRLWESPVPFVVLGVSQILSQEVYDLNCRADRVPILRRCSAGGCVLQGPGCLNFTLTLRHKLRPEIQTIRGSYCAIIDSLCTALEHRGIRAHHKGISDIAVGGKKVSGSAQKRRKRAILHHGTLLYRVDPERMARYLREPSERPQYRGPRTHGGFVAALPLTAQEVRETVREAFQTEGRPEKPRSWEIEAAEELAREKYARTGWTRRR